MLTYMGHKAAPLARAMIGAMLGGFVVLEFGDPLCSLIAGVGLGFAGFLVHCSSFYFPRAMDELAETS